MNNKGNVFHKYKGKIFYTNGVNIVYLSMSALIDYTMHIEIDPQVRFGKPVIKGTRITVYDILQWLASGSSHQQILEDFPQLTAEHIFACLAYAADKERKVKFA